MVTSVRRLAFVAFVVVVLACCATAAQASSWTTGLQAASKGMARADVVPNVPAGVTVVCTSPTTKVLQVSWSSVSHATYTIWQSTTSATTGFTAVTTAVVASPWTSGTLANNTYWYQVSAEVGTNWKSANSAAPAAHTTKNGATNCS